MGAGCVVATLPTPSGLSALSIDPAAAPSTGAVETSWYRRIKRIGQTNFNEKDPQYGNVEKWADYWASAKVGAVALSVSGPLAFYPTEVPFFNPPLIPTIAALFGSAVRPAQPRASPCMTRLAP